MASKNAAAVPENRALPKKENDLFKSIAKHYETKQYKKGIKAIRSRAAQWTAVVDICVFATPHKPRPHLWTQRTSASA